jgi:hypothetical protein
VSQIRVAGSIGTLLRGSAGLVFSSAYRQEVAQRFKSLTAAHGICIKAIPDGVKLRISRDSVSICIEAIQDGVKLRISLDILDSTN